jgi:hypothetical protein
MVRTIIVAIALMVPLYASSGKAQDNPTAKPIDLVALGVKNQNCPR